MSRWTPLLGAFVSIAAVNLVSVPFLLNPVAEGDVGVPLAHPAAGFFVYVALSVALFDWTARQMSNA